MDIKIQLGFDPAKVVAAAFAAGSISLRTDEPHTLPLNQELTLKEFCQAEARRLGIGYNAVQSRIYRKLYKGKIKFRRVNKRVVFVTVVRATC